MALVAADDRLAAAVECSGNTENVACANFIPPGSTDDAEQDFVGSGPVGFDRWDTMYPFAPKPMLVTVSDKDFFGTYSPHYITNGWEEFQRLQKVYEVLGHGDRLKWVDTPLPHGLELDTRLEVYNWFGRWLKGQEQPIEKEPPTKPEPDKTLWVAQSGNVVRTFGGTTPFAMNRSRTVEKTPADLRVLLGVPATSEPPMTTLRRVPSLTVDVEAVEVASAPKVWVPAWLFLPRGNAHTKPVVLVIEAAGRNYRWDEGGMYQALAERGYPVCAADLRGVGDMAPEIGPGDPNYMRPHRSEENYAWASLILGRPLLGQRVADILALVAGLRKHPALGGRPVVVAARGKMTVPAIFAAALDPNISELYLERGLVSFRSIVDTEIYDHSFANFVPDMLSAHRSSGYRGETRAAPRAARGHGGWRRQPHGWRRGTQHLSGRPHNRARQGGLGRGSSVELESVKACLLRAPAPVSTNPLALSEVPTPRPSEGQVLVRVSACGVCRTDLHVVEGELPPRKSPVIPGHQVVGVIEQLGDGARRFQVGARVGIPWLHETDGVCEYCRSAKENLCGAAIFTGYMVDGGYAEYAVAPEAFVYPIPESFSDLDAAPLLCAGIIGFRALRLSEIGPGGRLGIYGFGAAAHVLIQVARHWGVEVSAFTRDAAHQRLALDLGAAWAGSSSAGYTNGHGQRALDSAIIFAPAGELVPLR